jgi:hypothetical protein
MRHDRHLGNLWRPIGSALLAWPLTLTAGPSRPLLALRDTCALTGTCRHEFTAQIPPPSMPSK